MSRPNYDYADHSDSALPNLFVDTELTTGANDGD